MGLSASETITVYSDYVCPFCYLGRAALRQYQASREQGLVVDWRPFDLRAGKRNPDGTIDQSADDGKDEAYYERARRNVRRLQERYDVEMVDELATDVDSLPAQLASYYVDRHYPHETWLAFDEAIFDALWRRGEDISDPDRLVELAETVDIDGAEIRAALGDEQLREELTDRFIEARRNGVTGVPTFVYGEHEARGAVPPEQLRRLVDGA